MRMQPIAFPDLPQSSVKNPCLSVASSSSIFHRKLLSWYRDHGRDLPWRRTRDPYAILVSEFMLQQTQVATVVPYYIEGLRRFPDFATLAAAPEAEVLRAWEGLGYYARARNLHATAKAIVRDHGGTFPGDPAIARQLPGLGKYTANAVATFAFDAAVPIVDANIARVLARLLDLAVPIDTAAGQRALWSAAATLLPEPGPKSESPRLHNSALMELGALLCRARGPQCLQCPVRPFCAAFAASTQEQRPVKKAPRATVELHETCAWIHSGGRVLLQQETGRRWRGLWKLPPLPETGRDDSSTALLQLTYPFTHHRVTLRVLPAPALAPLLPGQQWHSLAALEGIALAAPHRRALRQLLVLRLPVTAD